MAIKGVIFDFNGTLFWDSKIHNKAWDIFLEKKGMSLSNKEKLEKIHGRNNKDILNTLFFNRLSHLDIEKYSLEKEKIYQTLCLRKKMQLAEGATNFLNFLKETNIAYTIVTASVIINVEFYFKHLGLSLYFDRSSIIYNDGQIMSKPNPQIYQKALSLLGLNANEVLVFEDSFAGILSAENANISKIIIVDSNNDDYSRWKYSKIKSFDEVDKNMFK